ncbi:MAG: hypothetical protein JNJ54_35050 [Myxococcaceae bacterium]|nr:hypothetical protein [Myxococcaceae bacterium]
MPASNPSPSGPASATAAGIVNLAVQTFAGVKTFAATLIASAGIQLGLLFNTNGTGSTDVVVKAGTSVADASVNAAATLFAVKTGIGGSEADNFRVVKRGVYIGNGVSAIGLTTVEGSYILDTGNLRSSSVQTTGYFYVTLGGVGYFFVDRTTFGRIDQYGTDSIASPGAATINRPIGKSAIAATASSVVITNSLVSAASHIIITPHARDATCKELIAVPAAGFFTVSGTAAATATLPFSWEVKGLL